jgi:hypothetical protein
MIEDVKEGIRNTLSEISDCEVSVSTFNNEINVDESTCKSSCFTMPDLDCRGGTRLFDCLVQVLNKEMNSSNTMIVVLTDGLNNAGTSSEEDVRNLILQFKDKNNVVKFLGANMDALLNAAVLGVDASDALTYDGAHVLNAFRTVSENITQYQQSGVNVPFLPPQRAASIATPRANVSASNSLQGDLVDFEPPKLRRCQSSIGW